MPKRVATQPTEVARTTEWLPVWLSKRDRRLSRIFGHTVVA